MNVCRKILAWAIASLFLLEGVCSFALADSLASFFRGAQNVASSAPLPSFVWRQIAVGCLCLGTGIIYLLDLAHIRRRIAWLCMPALVYGTISYRQVSPYILSWSGVLHGDLLALEGAEALGFCLLGALGVLKFLIDRVLDGRRRS